MSIPLPPRGAHQLEYVEFVRGVCDAHGVERVIARDDVASLLASGGVPTLTHTEWSVHRPVPKGPSGFELVQFSSGTTGPPHGVLVDDRLLGVNVSLAVVQPRPGDALVSWLPLSHDMGLVGMLFMGIAACASSGSEKVKLSFLDPLQFLRAPSTWMKAISEDGATVTAAPDFGYRLATRYASGLRLDLSRLRCAIVGGEIVRPDTLEALCSTFSGSGLRRESLCPAYGLAEVGLAVSLTPPDEPFTVVTGGASGANAGRAESDTVVPLVASGTPLDGYTARAERTSHGIDQLLVSGPRLGCDGLTGRPLAREDGFLETGDVGRIEGGRLVVAGRMDDYFVVHGRKVFAPAVEQSIALIDGLREGRVVAAGLPTGDWVVCGEVDTHTSVDRSRLVSAARAVATRLANCAPSAVVLLPPGSVPMTSSGKIQRFRVAEAYLNDALPQL